MGAGIINERVLGSGTWVWCGGKDEVACTHVLVPLMAAAKRMVGLVVATYKAGAWHSTIDAKLNGRTVSQQARISKCEDHGSDHCMQGALGLTLIQTHEP